MKSDRCFALIVLACAMFTLAAGQAHAASQVSATSATTSIYSIPVKPMAGDTTAATTLTPYRGKVLLIVNVASKCGFTPQYTALESVYRKYKDRGLVVLGFPANDFKSQEPGSDAEIAKFCKLNYDVSFPVYSKIHVVGAGPAPLYQYLTGPASPQPGPVKWNFEKFVIGRDGRIAARFRSKDKPDSQEVIAAIEQALAQ